MVKQKKTHSNEQDIVKQLENSLEDLKEGRIKEI